MERTIVVLIDALGFELCRKHGFRIRGFESEARLRTVLGFSQAALATIFTGRSPAEHGLWMMYAFRERGAPLRWLRLVPFSVSSRRLWLRRLVAWNLRRVHGVRGYFSLYDVPREVLQRVDLPARGDMFAPGGAAPVPTVFDALADARVPTRVWDYRSDEERAFAELEGWTGRGEARFALLYTARLDADLHRFGSGSGAVAARLARYREAVERIAETARRSGGARIFVLGDHGMCDVRSRIDVMGPVERLGLRIGHDFVPFYDSTMARFKVIDPPAGERLAELLAATASGRLLERGEMESLGVLFPDGRFGDIVFLADPGVIIAPSFMGEGAVAAMHGYHPSAEGMYSIMLSNVELPAGEIALEAVADTMLPGFAGGGGVKP